MAYDDAVEQIINFRFNGLSDAPRQFQDAIAAVNQFDQSLQALQKNQATLQKQFNTAQPQQQQKIESQLNTIAYQIDQATTARQQAATHADDQAYRLKQFDDLARRLSVIEQKRTTAPPLPGPAENFSPEAQQIFTEKQTELQQAQGKFQRARSDASKGKWSQEIDRLQAELAQIPEQLVRTAYAEPAAEIRRRLVALQHQTGQAVSNAQFAQVSRDVQQGRFLTPEEDPELTAGRMAIMNPPNRAQRFGSRVLANLKDYGGLNVAYAAMDVLNQSGQAIALTQSGNRVSPEAQQRAWAGIAPGIGGIIGAAVGGWPGSLIGGGIGSLAQGLFDANSERTEKVRNTAEDISTSLGRGTAAADKFAAVLESSAKTMGTPVVELANSMSQISRSVSGFSMTGATGLQAYLQSQLGEQYQETVGPQVKATTAPFSQSYRDMLAGKTAPSGDLYNGMASYYDAIGDRDTADKLRSAGAAIGTDPRIAQLQGQINAQREWQKNNPGTTTTWWNKWLSPQHEKNADGSYTWRWETTEDAKIRQTQQKLDAAQAQDKNSPNAVSAAQSKAAGDNLADTMQNARDEQAMRASEAATAASKAQQALERGEGVAGLRRYAAGETGGLVKEQSAYLSQQKALTDRIGSLGTDNPASGALKALLADVRKQIADVQGQMQSIDVDIFRQGVSEDDAALGGRSARLGLRGNTLLLSGASAFDSRVGGNYADQETLLRRRARHDENLADDPNNYLSPEERQARRTQASQEMFQARYALPNEYAQRRIQARDVESQVRQSRLNLDLVHAQTSGSIGDIYDAQKAQANEAEQHRNDLQEEYTRLVLQGIGTMEQREQLQTRINGLEAQATQLRQQALETGYQARSAELTGASEAGGAIARRFTFGGGTTAASFGASTVSLAAEKANVEVLRQKSNEPGLEPSKRAQRLAEYESAAAKLDTDVVDAYGTYREDVGTRRQRQKLESQEQIMAISPLFPGNRLGVDARLNSLEQTKLTGISGAKQRVNMQFRMGTISADQRDNSLAKLEAQEQETQTAIAQRSASFAESLFSNKIAQSINAPSFASRFLPSDSDVAAIAEKRGLGPYSARVFGSVSAQARQDTLTLGMTAPDMNLSIFGKRPGDFDDGGAGLTGMGRGNTGGSSAGSGADAGTSALSAELAALKQEIAALRQQGLHLSITVNNGDTGQQTGHVVNALANSGDTARAIMKGGGKPQGW